MSNEANTPDVSAAALGSEELLPCPFCGFRDDDQPTCHDKSGTPYCPNCGAVGPCNPEAWGENGEDIADNHVLWNRRTSEDLARSILNTLTQLSERGWCVVLKKLPPRIGWLI